MRKIRTVNVSDYYEYNEDYLTSLNMILERSRYEYCTLRDFIEEEIIKRQAKWRISLSNPSIQKAANTKKTSKETTDGQDKPPPASSPVDGHTQKPAATPSSSFSHQPAAKTQDPVEPKATDNSKEPRETRLIYRSDFYSSSDNWLEGEKDGIKRFCLKKVIIISF